jgi:hypothetical protein
MPGALEETFTLVVVVVLGRRGIGAKQTVGKPAIEQYGEGTSYESRPTFMMRFADESWNSSASISSSTRWEDERDL